MTKEVDIAFEIKLYLHKANMTQTMAAATWGVSRQYLSKVMNGHCDPSEKMLDAIGFERVVTKTKYRKVKK